ncbi:hypothetical protein JXA47_10945 [Candidatus Sumerlaeota bacterium]|nr:hypothetical protein [Candidatus Sumerlaeota bacterium]
MRSIAIALALLAVVPAAAQEAETRDLVDDLTRRALVAALLGDTVEIARVQGHLETIDANRLTATGLAENVETLRNAVSLGAMARFSEAQRETARSAGTRDERRLLRSLADSQPWPTIQRLRWENGYNRFAGVFNWLLRRLSQVLTGQTQALLQMVNDMVFAPRAFLYPTARERKMHALACHVAVQPGSGPEARAAERLANRIERKMERDRQRDLERRTRLALQQGQWETAQALAEGALTLWPGDGSLRRMMLEADHQIGLRRRGWERSLLVDPVGERGFTEIDWEDLGDALRAWLTGDDDWALFLVNLVEEDASPASPIRDDAEMLRALIEARLGRSAEARARLDTLSRSESALAWEAREILTHPPFDPDREVTDALERRSRLTRRLIWLGARGVEENLYLASSSAISEGLAAPLALGVFFSVDTSIRALAIRLHNPLGAERVVDSLASLDRRRGLTDEQRALLRDHLRALGRLEEALEVNSQLQEPDQRFRARAQRAIARQLLDLAQSTIDPEQRRRILTRIVENHPGTFSASEAWRMLHEEPWRGVHLTRAEVRTHRESLLEAGLPLEARLIDGDAANQEIDEDGLWIGDDGCLHCRLEGSRVWETFEIHGETADRLRGAALALVDRREDLASLDARGRSSVPLEVTGSLGAAGVYAVPQLQRFRHIDDDLPLYE